jgi:hypothetical protein
MRYVPSSPVWLHMEQSTAVTQQAATHKVTPLVAYVCLVLVRCWSAGRTVHVLQASVGSNPTQRCASACQWHSPFMSDACPFMPSRWSSNARVLVLLLSAMHDPRMHGLKQTCFCLPTCHTKVHVLLPFCSRQHWCLQVERTPVNLSISIP